MSYTPIDYSDPSSKRRQSNHRTAIKPNSVLRYNAAHHLSNVAFTELFVTANYSNFSPTTSYIILYLDPEQDTQLFRALCHVLPAVYEVSPDLQATGVTLGGYDPRGDIDAALERILPIHMTVWIADETVQDDFGIFRKEVYGREEMYFMGDGAIVVVSPDGNCVWNSVESLPNGAKTEGDVRTLQRQLVRVVGGVA